MKKIRKAVKKAAKTVAAKVLKPKIKKMTKDELKRYKAILIAERDRMEGQISHVTENALKRSARDASGDLSGYSYHMADVASDDYERDFSLGRATEEQKVVFLIDEALKRIEEGTYGACLQCGKAIPKRRLAALPHSELCIQCQEEKEVK